MQYLNNNTRNAHTHTIAVGQLNNHDGFLRFLRFCFFVLFPILRVFVIVVFLCFLFVHSTCSGGSS